VHAATPKKGGKFILGIGHGSTTDSLDSTTHENGFSQNIVYTYANHLFEIDSYDQLHPKLVHSYDSADSASK
jgi:peptide/nickel transport system substrate-binding protein